MKNKRIMISILTLFVLLGTSITMYCSYDRIDKQVKKDNNTQDYDISGDMYRILYDTSFAIANTLDIENGNQNSLESKYFNIHNEKVVQESKDSGYYEQDVSRLRNLLKTGSGNLTNEPNLKYFAKNTASGKTDYNDDTLNPSTLSQGIDKKMSKYRWYLKVVYDSEGKVFYENLLDTDKGYDDFIAYMSEYDINSNYRDSEFQTNNLYDDAGSSLGQGLSLKNPKNVEYVFAIPMELQEDGQIYYLYNSIYENWYESIVIPYILIGLFVVMLYMLFTPVSILKDTYIFRHLSRIKLEFWLIAYGSVISIIAMIGPESVHAVQNGQFAESLKEIGLYDLNFLIESLLIVGMWTIFFGVAMFGVYHLKYIFHKGMGKYFKENTICGWAIFKLEKMVYRVLSFDLKDDVNNTVFKIVAINFVIIAILGIIFGFGGIFFALIYSIIILVILTNKMNRIKYDYQSLLKATKKLSSGDFNAEINQDLGWFNSLGKEFGNIKNGFKKAVEEEVKSQKMKTELISNVSHDLKTPLTSIITYVDLLKKDDISKEDEKQYIDTIDRNSQRLKNLIEDLFEMSKANSGNVNLNIMNVDIVSLIKQAQFECADSIEEVGLECRVNFESEKVICPLDSSKTYRIFENLLMNICKYAMPNTRVYIDLKDYEDHVEVTFKNISANEIDFAPDEIVERFARGDKSRNSDGSGLGLAIAKSFTELQNGTFKVETDGDLFKAVITLRK